MRNTLVLSCEYQLIREKTSFHLHITLWPCSMTQSAQAHHRLPKKISTSQLLGRSAVPPCKGGRQRFVDGATMESSFTFINQVMVRSTQQYLRHHNGSGQFGGTFSDRFHRPPWLQQQQWECLTSNFAKSLHPGWQVEPPCSTRALNFTTGWPRLRWSEYLLGFWHKEQHDRVLS